MDVSLHREEQIFATALALVDVAQRRAYLDEACAGEAGLQARLERLLATHQHADEFFVGCVSGLTQSWSDSEHAVDKLPGPAEVDEQLGKHVGPYKLLQKIGEGGCGVVYMAEQEKPVRRRVALKIIKLGMDTKQVIARFEAERQALAMMDHPNIARVLDAGATELGRPYFVMELVHGVRITTFCDERKFDTHARLDLFIQVCHAIQHAHQKGIIHRDIKPSNILVTLHDGVPVPKVIDFGIAKATQEPLTDKTLFTAYGHFVGTPVYMSPEQADISGLDVDTRSDIYSLGVLLYELLTGKTPFDSRELMKSGLDEMRRALREDEPQRPSTRLNTLRAEELTATALHRQAEPPKLKSQLSGDLDWIVMKALEKNRGRRYETANALAMDIQRHLNNEPVIARPPSRWYRFEKLVRRNQGVFATVGAVAVALILGLSVSTWLFFKERTARRRAVAAEQQQMRMRQEAETREKITQATILVSRGSWTEAETLMQGLPLPPATLEGAAVFRALAEWHALQGRWAVAGVRYQQLGQINQLDGAEIRAQDFLAGGAVLAVTGDQTNFESFRQAVIKRFSTEAIVSSALVGERFLKASLLLPMEQNTFESLQLLLRAVGPKSGISVGNPRPITTAATSRAGSEFLEKFRLQAIGTQSPCSLTSTGGVITIVAGGADIWGLTDELAFFQAPMAGDFDCRLRVQSFNPYYDGFTRVGLMARESKDGEGSRHVMVTVNATNSFQVLQRPEEAAPSVSHPFNPLPPAPGSNSWVRLQRSGAVFHAYVSDNGVDWQQLYQTTGGAKPFADPIFFGIAANAHSSNQVATFVVSDFEPTPTISASAALAFALLEYRRDNFEKAAAWCRRTLAYPECDLAHVASGRAILAMATAQLGQTTVARTILAPAQALVERKFADVLDPGVGREGFWIDWVCARVLLQEANLRLLK